jgi:hypothetical protein
LRILGKISKKSEILLEKSGKSIFQKDFEYFFRKYPKIKKILKKIIKIWKIKLFEKYLFLKNLHIFF